MNGTQENCRAPDYKERQEEIELDGKKVWADPELIPLLKALNEVGLTTRSHCAGHESDNAFIVIKTDNIYCVEVKTEEPYNEVVISWQRRR